jgi:AcrR family transcriptional regulator
MVQHGERADARLNRERLLTAAAGEFAAHGLNAEIKEIAERAGLSVGAVYRHFPSKDDLVAAVLDQVLGEFDRVLDAAAAVEDGDAAVRCFIAGGVGVAERFGGMLTALLEGGGLKPFRAASAERRAALNERLTALIARGVASGRLRRDLDPRVGAAVLESLLAPWLVAGLRDALSAEQVVEALSNLYLHGAAAGR